MAKMCPKSILSNARTETPFKMKGYVSHDVPRKVGEEAINDPHSPAKTDWSTIIGIGSKVLPALFGGGKNKTNNQSSGNTVINLPQPPRQNQDSTANIMNKVKRFGSDVGVRGGMGVFNV